MAVPDTVESLGPNLFEAVPETRTYFGYRPFDNLTAIPFRDGPIDPDVLWLPSVSSIR